jgi:hypothetical protein
MRRRKGKEERNATLSDCGLYRVMQHVTSESRLALVHANTGNNEKMDLLEKKYKERISFVNHLLLVGVEAEAVCAPFGKLARSLLRAK